MSDSSTAAMGPESALVSDRISALSAHYGFHPAVVDEFGWDPTEATRDSPPAPPRNRPREPARGLSWFHRLLRRTPVGGARRGEIPSNGSC